MACSVTRQRISRLDRPGSSPCRHSCRARRPAHAPSVAAWPGRPERQDRRMSPLLAPFHPAAECEPRGPGLRRPGRGHAEGEAGGIARGLDQQAEQRRAHQLQQAEDEAGGARGGPTRPAGASRAASARNTPFQPIRRRPMPSSASRMTAPRPGRPGEQQRQPRGRGPPAEPGQHLAAPTGRPPAPQATRPATPAAWASASRNPASVSAAPSSSTWNTTKKEEKQNWETP